MTLPGPVLVTGASGFIGGHLVASLVASGVPVRALVLPGEAIDGTPWAPSIDRVEVVRGDVTDAASVDAAMAGAGGVVHLAAVVQDWGTSALHRRVTVDGTRHVLSAAATLGVRAVLASSIVVYGHQLGRVVCHEDLPAGYSQGLYSRSKQAQERLARELEAGQDLDLVIVRPANVFGPGSQPWVAEVLDLLRRRQFTLIGGGDHDAGLCHVDNLVELLWLALTRPEARGRVYNAADGAGITWRRYFGDLAKMARTQPPRSLPQLPARLLAQCFELLWKVLPARRRPPITREALNLTARPLTIPIDRARDELGYQPQTTYPQAIEGLAAVLRDGRDVS